MGYDREIAERIRVLLAEQDGLAEREMFGGLAFLLRGHMTVVASGKGGLLVRTDPSSADELVQSTPADYAEMRGRVMKGWLRLEPADIETSGQLATWVKLAATYATTLPPKT